jgi:RNA polymerase sigma-70 factor (ECF subfamily)
VAFKDDKPPDEEPIERVYERFRQELKHHFKRFGDGAEDRVQLVYMRLMRQRGLAEIRNPESLFRWLARFVLLKESPRLTEEARLIVNVDPTASEDIQSAHFGVSPDDSSEEVVQAELARHIQALPLAQRQVLVLHWLKGRTIPETAMATGYKQDAVKKYLGLAIDHLRKCYGDDTLGSR